MFQTEKCPETGRLHQQGYFILPSKRKLSPLKKLFPSWHLELRKGTHGQARRYCSKEDTRIDVPIFFGTEPEDPRPGRRTDLEDVKAAISSGVVGRELFEQFSEVVARYPRFVEEYSRLVARDRVLANLPEFAPRPGWQTDLFALLSGPVHPRRVHWRYETTGNVGKSYFALNYNPKETFVVTNGKHADIIYAYKGEGVVIFDWPRTNEDTFPYGLVEQFKNGFLFSTKYQSTQLRFPPPHVVVFANFRPQEEKLSADRWDIQNIGLYPVFE